MTLWVVEMRVRNRWEPTVGVALTRGAGHDELRQWREDNPSDQFRLRRWKQPE